MLKHLPRTISALLSAALAITLLSGPRTATAQSGAVAENVFDSGTSLSVTFSDPNTSLAILHYVLNGGGQQNVAMPASGAQFAYAIPVAAGAAETMTYSFTYQVGGVQYDTGGYSFTRGPASQTPVQAQATTPAFSLPSGSYNGTQTVTLSDSTPNAALLCSIDGAAQSACSNPILVGSSETITATATATGMTNSPPATVSYTISNAGAASHALTDGGSSLAVSFSYPNASLAIMHYVSASGGSSTGQQNVTMSGSNGAFSYPVPATAGAPETLSYTFTYQVNGTQFSDPLSGAYSFMRPVSTQVATPVISPGSGTYPATQNFVLSDATPNAAIFYTTDGSNPATSATSKQYLGALSFAGTTTLEAYATLTGSTPSSVASATLTISQPQTPAPVISPASGNYTATQKVTILDSNSNALILYTTDGSNPGTSSTARQYTSAFSVSTATTVEAYATLAGDTASSVVTSTLTFNNNGSPHNFTQNVVEQGSSAIVHLTLNYTMPTGIMAAPILTYSVANASGVVVTQQTSPYMTLGGSNSGGQQWVSAPIQGLQTGYVFAYFFTYSDSNGSGTVNENAPATAPGQPYTYTFCGSSVTGACVPSIALPTFSPAGGSYSSAQTVTINASSSWPAQTAIFYTTDGAVPSPGASDTLQYSNAVTISSSTNLSAIAVEPNGGGTSRDASANYLLQVCSSACPVDAPVFSAPAGTYLNQLYLFLDSSTPGATVFYTLDGSNPSTSSARFAAGAGLKLAVGTTTVKTVAALNGISSSTSVAQYVVGSTSQSTWNGKVTINLANGSAGEYANSRIHWLILGQDPNNGNQFVFVKSDGTFAPMASQTYPVSANGDNYGDFSYTLDQVSSIPLGPITSARIYFSIDQGVLIAYTGTGYAGPSFDNASDPNLNTIFDFAEFNLNAPNSNPGLWVNNGQVDMFGLPIELNVTGLDSFNATVGFPINEGTADSRQALFSEFIGTVPSQFQTLARVPYAPYRIVAPAHGSFDSGFDPTGSPDGLPAGANAAYLDSYTQQVWNKYQAQPLVLTLSNGNTYTGNVDASGNFNFVDQNGNRTDAAGNQLIIPSNQSGYNGCKDAGVATPYPSTAEIMLGDGNLNCGVAGSMALQLQAQMAAALNRHVADQPFANWSNPASYFVQAPANYYMQFWHQHQIDALAYGMAYDDAQSNSASIQTAVPQIITFTIGK